MKILYLKCSSGKKPLLHTFQQCYRFSCRPMRTSHRSWTCLFFRCCFLKRIIFPFLFLYQPTSWLVCKGIKTATQVLTSVVFWAQTSLQWQVSVYSRSSWGTEGVPDLPLAPDPPALQGQWKIPTKYCVFLFPRLKKSSSKCTCIYRAARGFQGRCLASGFQKAQNSCTLCCLSPALWDKL